MTYRMAFLSAAAVCIAALPHAAAAADDRAAGDDDEGRPAAFARGPGGGRPDVGCTTERAETVTPAGWRKIVTHRTCYRR